MSTSIFTKTGIWDGGLYELAIEIGPSSHRKLRRALQALWDYPSLSGCYLDRTREPDDQERVDSSMVDIENGSHVYGIATLPNRKGVACGAYVITETEIDRSEELTFYLPMGALGEAYPVGAHPFDWSNPLQDAWQRPLDDWLADIGRYVFTVVAFRLGLIGFEPEDEKLAGGILVKNQPPRERHIGYLWPDNGKLQYLPKNK